MLFLAGKCTTPHTPAGIRQSGAPIQMSFLLAVRGRCCLTIRCRGRHSEFMARPAPARSRDPFSGRSPQPQGGEIHFDNSGEIAPTLTAYRRNVISLLPSRRRSASTSGRSMSSDSSLFDHMLLRLPGTGIFVIYALEDVAFRIENEQPLRTLGTASSSVPRIQPVCGKCTSWPQTKPERGCNLPSVAAPAWPERQTTAARHTE